MTELPPPTPVTSKQTDIPTDLAYYQTKASQCLLAREGQRQSQAWQELGGQALDPHRSLWGAISQASLHPRPDFVVAARSGVLALAVGDVAPNEVAGLPDRERRLVDRMLWPALVRTHNARAKAQALEDAGQTPLDHMLSAQQLDGYRVEGRLPSHEALRSYASDLGRLALYAGWLLKQLYRPGQPPIANRYRLPPGAVRLWRGSDGHLRARADRQVTMNLGQGLPGDKAKAVA